MATLYQKVKKTLGAMAPATFPQIAAQLGADEDAVRQALDDLKRRGKARVDERRSDIRGEMWRPA